LGYGEVVGLGDGVLGVEEESEEVNGGYGDGEGLAGGARATLVILEGMQKSLLYEIRNSEYQPKIP
jgi:hypothetical protein